ncbi:MAG: YHYH protein, partial [Phycisphaerales bacterium]
PLPQPYSGDNAWRIPLKPVFAAKPISAKTNLYRGAIALAVNGIPIFNALNNRGDDTYKVGELDNFGGHCGRSDDYHYHIAPLVLQKVVGPENPIAYALDGFALYGYFTKGAKKGEEGWCPLGGVDALDEFNGHFGTHTDGSSGVYHYHASPDYPYINGGMKGEVEVVDDQIEPQPQARGVRQWLQALQGASITDFKEVKPQSWSLEYRISGAKYFVNYRIDGTKFIFDFVTPDGSTTSETYEARARGRGRGGEDRPAGEESERGRGREGGRNRDGDNRQPGAGGEGREPGSGGGQGPKGPSADGARQPWIIAHAAEIDADQDGALTRDEVLDQAKTAFEAYDKDKSGALEVKEYDRNAGARPVRSPMGGFIQLHAKELDSNADGSIARDELLGTTGRMFDKSDANRDSTLGKDELAGQTRATQPGSEQPRERRGNGGGGGQGGGGNTQPGGRGNQGPGEGQSLRERMAAFRTEVPKHPYNVIASNIDSDSVDVSIVHHSSAQGYIEYGSSTGRYKDKSAPVEVKPGEPINITLPLRGCSEIFYRWTYKNSGEGSFESSPEYRLSAPRVSGVPFTFTIQADSHLDSNMDTTTYAKSLDNALKDRPDFHIDLGDTFMTDKR